MAEQLLIVVSLGIVALILPFTYSLIKNLYTEVYKDYGELKKELKGKIEEKKLQKAKGLVKSIEDFHRVCTVMMVLLFFACIFSFFFGFCKITKNLLLEQNLVLILVSLEGALLIAYLIVFCKYKPLKTLRELKTLNLDIGGGSVKMKRQWSITKLVAAGSLGVVHLVFILPGVGIVAMTGIPGMGAVTNLFVDGVFFAFCCLLINKFGAATLMGFVATVSAIPLPYFGTPGFLPKVIIGIVIGLVADCTYFLLRTNKKIAAIAIGGFVALSGAFVLLGIGLLFSIPGIEKLANLFLRPVAIVAVFIYGAFAGYVGYLIYNRLKDTTVARRIQL